MGPSKPIFERSSSNSLGCFHALTYLHIQRLTSDRVVCASQRARVGQVVKPIALGDMTPNQKRLEECMLDINKCDRGNCTYAVSVPRGVEPSSLGHVLGA
eukprot:968020-Pyramimonas_sp.AAC.1